MRDNNIKTTIMKIIKLRIVIKIYIMEDQLLAMFFLVNKENKANKLKLRVKNLNLLN